MGVDGSARGTGRGVPGRWRNVATRGADHRRWGGKGLVCGGEKMDVAGPSRRTRRRVVLLRGEDDWGVLPPLLPVAPAAAKQRALLCVRPGGARGGFPAVPPLPAGHGRAGRAAPRQDRPRLRSDRNGGKAPDPRGAGGGGGLVPVPSPPGLQKGRRGHAEGVRRGAPRATVEGWVAPRGDRDADAL